MAFLVDIYEGQDTNPIIGHVFYGSSWEAVQPVVNAHIKTDEFFRGAMRQGKWHNIPLRMQVRQIFL